MSQSARFFPAAHAVIHGFTKVMRDNRICGFDTRSKAKNSIGGTDFDLR